MGTVQFTFNTSGGSPDNLLLTALTHHHRVLTSLSRFESRVVYSSIKGPMTGVLGAHWQLAYPLHNVSWYSPGGIDRNRVEAVRSALMEDRNLQLQPTHPDPYFAGAELGKTARLILIAEELGETATATQLRSQLAGFATPWLIGQGTDPWLCVVA